MKYIFKKSAAKSEKKRVSLPVVKESAAPSDVDSELTPPPGYDDKYPPLDCSTCNIGVSCPKYAEGYVCFFNDRFRVEFGADPVQRSDTLADLVNEVVADTMQRYRYARLQERTSGGNFIDPRVTQLGSEALRQATFLREWHTEQRKLKVTVEAEASGEDAPRKAGGLLKSLFGVAGGSEPPSNTLPPPSAVVVMSEDGNRVESVVGTSPTQDSAAITVTMEEKR